MEYITRSRAQPMIQLTFDRVFEGPVNMCSLHQDETATWTYRINDIRRTPYTAKELDGMIRKLRDFNRKYAALFDADRPSLYRSFKIPKTQHKGRTVEWRQIDAPEPPLMAALNELKTLLERDFYATYHTSAFAYAKGRCGVDAVKRHQRNGSNWFQKIDFKNFFGSTTEDFVFRMFCQSYPFHEIQRLSIRIDGDYVNGGAELRKALSLCFLNGVLPQGSPVSPLITNEMMIPFDYQLSRRLRNMDKKFVYTRYADDMIFSSVFAFPEGLESVVQEVCRELNAPFRINTEKTRYGSRAGRNWNLGVMLNQQNKITIGSKKKSVFRATLHKYTQDVQAGSRWSISEAQSLSGLISYYRMVEPDDIDRLIREKSAKTGIDILLHLKDDCKPNRS